MTTPGRAPVPLLMRMAAHPLRWALMTELASGDRRMRELVAAVGEPQNLVSYHLRLLRATGLVVARRSSFDGRDSYYHLDLARCASAFGETAAARHPALAATDRRRPKSGSVLFLCAGNSARSPIAEALLRHRVDGVRVTSAGSHPAPRLHPNTVRVLREDYGEVPRDHDSATTTHWSMPDPSAAADTDRSSYPEFRRLAQELDLRIGFLTL